MAVRLDSVNYQPPRQLAEFERLYAPLMMFLAAPGDCVVADRPTDDFLRYWSDKGVDIPPFISLAEARRRVADGQLLRPWGWSREVFYRFGGHALADSFTPDHRSLFSRRSSVLLEHTLASMPLPLWCQVCFSPVIVDSVELLTQLVMTSPCVVKSLWSASGRGVSIVSQPQFRQPAISRYSTHIVNDGAVVVEKLLNRKADFAMLFWIDKSGEVNYIGKNFYRSDDAGRFGVELIGYDPIAPFVASGDLPADWEYICANALRYAIRQMNWHTLYNGPVGIDSMIYSDDSGNVRIRLCVEANIRFTMGNVNLRVSQCFTDQQVQWTLGGDMLISLSRNG